MAKQKLSSKEDFLTFSDLRESELPVEDRNLAGELYKKNWQATTIDSFEKSIGIVPKQQKLNLKYKSRVFSPDYDKDAELLNELMNHPKFTIIYWKDNWTVEGLYKVFAIYSENLDFKTTAEITKEIAER